MKEIEHHFNKKPLSFLQIRLMELYLDNTGQTLEDTD